MTTWCRRWRLRSASSAVLAVAFAVVFCASVAHADVLEGEHFARPVPRIAGPMPALSQKTSAPPIDSMCRAQYQRPCYSPSELRRAYGVDTG